MAGTATLADAYVRVRADMKPAAADVKKGLTDAGEKAGREAGKKAGDGFVGGLLKATAALAGAHVVVDFFKGMVDEATEANKTGAQTTAVLKSTGSQAHITADQVGNLATAISNKIGVDDEAIQANENLLLTFTRVRNEVGRGNDVFNRATQDISDMSAALGTAGPAAAIQLGKALNDPIKGITALSRAGVSFTEGQKKQIATMVKNKDLLGAQKIILKEVEKEFGGSAAAIATPGEKMRVAWGNLQETLGLKLMPWLAKLEDWVTVAIPKILDFVNGVQSWAAHSSELHSIVSGLVSTLQTLYSVAVSVIGYIADHETAFKGIAAGILAVVAAMTVWAVITKIMAIQQAILDAALNANPIGLIILAIVGLVAAFVYLWNHSEAFRKFWIDLWGSIWGFLKMVGAWFAGPFVDFFVSAAKAIAAPFVWLWHNVLDPIWQAISVGAQFVFRIVSSLINLFVFLASVVLNLVWKSSIKPAIDGIAAAAQWLYHTILQPIFKLIVAVVKTAGAEFSWLWKNAIKPAFDGIGKAASWAWDHVLHPIFKTVMGVVDDVGDKFKKVFAAIGGFISGAFDTAVGVVKGSINGLIDVLDSAIGFINRDVIDVANKVPGVNFPHIPMIPHLAVGGQIVHGGAAIIDEAGPGSELVDLPAGATVSSAGQTGEIVELLKQLIDAVMGVAPGVGQQLHGAAAGVLVQARAR